MPDLIASLRTRRRRRKTACTAGYPRWGYVTDSSFGANIDEAAARRISARLGVLLIRKDHPDGPWVRVSEDGAEIPGDVRLLSAGVFWEDRAKEAR